jgi:hypothetical protein
VRIFQIAKFGLLHCSSHIRKSFSKFQIHQISDIVYNGMVREIHVWACNPKRRSSAQQSIRRTPTARTPLQTRLRKLMILVGHRLLLYFCLPKIKSFRKSECWSVDFDGVYLTASAHRYVKLIKSLTLKTFININVLLIH